jgi:hypothetical protein
MKIIHNERGIALITALLITMLSLVIAIGLLYVITQNTRLGGSQKTYRNAVEASYGGAEVMMNEILPRFFDGISLSTPLADNADSILSSFPSEMNLVFYSKADGSCLQDKLLKAPFDWAANCTSGVPATDPTNVNPRIAPDVRFELQGPSNQSFVVYSKIVDTIPGTPYLPPLPGGPLGGSGVASLGGNGTPSGQHYVYRIEIAGEQTNNPAEKGELSVLYEN